LANTIAYIIVMAFLGYHSYRMFDGVRVGVLDRQFWLGPRWHVRLRREPVLFCLTMFLWLAFLVFFGVMMIGLSYGYWTGKWDRGR
jgi:hypothetical protein